MTSDSTERNFVVVRDAEALAIAAAKRVVSRIHANPERPAICLAGGSSPKALYGLLGNSDYAPRIPWNRVHWFIGDERFVPGDDKLSNMGMARKVFLNRCAPVTNIHPIPTDAANPAAAARLYESELQVFYGSDRLDQANPLFDLILMGLGRDGHTGSLFPGAAALNETAHWAVGVEHANVEPLVPRVTLTYPTLASSREMLFLVSGSNKREVLSRVKAGDDLPAARAHSNGTTTWLVDTAAGAAP